METRHAGLTIHAGPMQSLPPKVVHARSHSPLSRHPLEIPQSSLRLETKGEKKRTNNNVKLKKKGGRLHKRVLQF
jgi:hypothetical protein